MTTKNSKRTDPHAAANLIPSNYAHVLTFAHAGTEDGWPVPAYNVDVLVAMMREHRFFHRHGTTSRCDVCGACFRFGDVFEHSPTGERIVVGWECADKIATLDRSTFDRQLGSLREATLAEARRAEKAEQRAAFFTANPGIENDLQGDHYILRDMAEKLERFGSLSEAQVALARKIADEARERATERKVPVAFVNGARAFVRGTVVSVKTVAGYRMQERKMTVKVTTPDGGVFLLYGACPASVATVGRGAVVEFSATIQHGQRDPSFGFFKRPTKAVLVGSVPAP